VIKRGAEQGHHFGVEIGRGRVGLPIVIVVYGVPDLQGGEAVAEVPNRRRRHLGSRSAPGIAPPPAPLWRLRS
jgi:hypothetical protein